MASAAEPSEPLNYKTWVLKVSIHCEGCKRKVKKILKSIPGVYDAEVDARQHKVTVKTVVDAETLIKRLGKSGKHATLWPEKKPGNQSPGNGETTKKKEDKESSVSKEPAESSEKKSIRSESSSASTAAAATAPAEASDADRTEAEAKPKPPTEPAKPDSKTEGSNVNEPQTTDATKANTSAQTPEKPAATVDEKASAAAEISSDKVGGKKKGHEAQKENSEAAGKDPDAGSINSSPPRHAYSHPAYVMSYNMAQPSASQAYYASPAPPASHGYVYMPFPPPPEFYYGSMDPSSPAPVQPAPHDNMFSDENPNACNIM
ncbi:Heavy-metal-associated domain [Musa troglodytarum]|uniref:Heavy-metal-associated domain n=1 Tax=Musa troglodytarum TaxID=320322 RepID=A0A9E7HL77_9LILI|nr:Heavy-metal-associated domain [Musa troglodytarum]